MTTQTFEFDYILRKDDNYDDLGEKVREDLELLFLKLGKPSVNVLVEFRGEKRSFSLEEVHEYDDVGEQIRDIIEPEMNSNEEIKLNIKVTN